MLRYVLVHEFRNPAYEREIERIRAKARYESDKRGRLSEKFRHFPDGFACLLDENLFDRVGVAPVTYAYRNEEGHLFLRKVIVRFYALSGLIFGNDDYVILGFPFLGRPPPYVLHVALFAVAYLHVISGLESPLHKQMHAREEVR